MKTGYRGTFVIAWSHTCIDGFPAASLSELKVGALWSWTGKALCVDGPQSVLRLDMADGEDDRRRRAAKAVTKLVGTARAVRHANYDADIANAPDNNSFVVTDGAKSYSVTLIPSGTDTRPLLMFMGEMPPRDRELWVVSVTLKPRLNSENRDGGVICFTPGTAIQTPTGPRPVEHLREGDHVLTRDNGPQEVLWTGARRISGARLYVMPHLRPVRIFSGAFGAGRPDKTLLVSPQHRLLVRGAEVQDLFNTPEALVAASDLDGTKFAETDFTVRAVTYVHLLLPRHEILWANGLETESFHPASAQLSTLGHEDRARLVAGLPDIEHDPHSYGDYARRNLTTGESALLNYKAA